MPDSRLQVRLLEFADSCGIPEEVVGDLLEEMAAGRSRAWLCRQLLALGGAAAVGRVRERAQVTPQGVAMTLSVLMLAGIAFVPLGRMLEGWLVLYCITGTLSLFAHMASEPPNSRHSNVERGADW